MENRGNYCFPNMENSAEKAIFRKRKTGKKVCFPSSETENSYIYKYIYFHARKMLFCMVGREFETLPSPIPNKNYAVDLKKDNRERS